MRATDTPSCAAPAATVRPPEPAPITHRSTRISPPAGSAITPFGAATGALLTSPERTRTKPTAPSLGCCMIVPPLPQNDRDQRNDTQKQQGQDQLPRDKGAGMNGEPAGLDSVIMAARVFRLRCHDDAVETGPRRGKGERGRHYAEKGCNHIGLEGNSQDGWRDVDKPEREGGNESQEEQIAERVLSKAFAQFDEPRGCALA